MFVQCCWSIHACHVCYSSTSCVVAVQAEGNQLTVKGLCKFAKQQWAKKHGSMPDSEALKSQLLAKVSLAHAGGVCHYAFA